MRRARPPVIEGETLSAFCWELEFPEVFFDGQGQPRSDAGFSCVLGNPPWDKIKPERDGFYLQFDPLIRSLQGTEKNRHIERLHRERPEVLAAWERYEATQKGLAAVLLKSGIYAHQTAEVEEEIEGDDGEDHGQEERPPGAIPTCSSSSSNGPGSLSPRTRRWEW